LTRRKQRDKGAVFGSTFFESRHMNVPKDTVWLSVVADFPLDNSDNVKAAERALCLLLAAGGYDLLTMKGGVESGRLYGVPSNFADTARELFSRADCGVANADLTHQQCLSRAPIRKIALAAEPT